MVQPIYESEQAEDPLYAELLVSEQQLDNRVEEMATEIRTEFKGENPLFVCLLRGGAPFTARLMFEIVRQDPNFHPEVDYMTIKTYDQELEPKPPEIVMGLAPTTKVAGRIAVPVDDTLDTGATLERTEDYLFELGALDVQAIVMVRKLLVRLYIPKIAMYGFDLRPEWLTGMGLDDPRLAKEANRWMSEIALANPRQAIELN